ncbi:MULTISPECIES: hypothetical protein [Paenibacillus]|nr:MULTISPECIES: hypothetical protein [Paenibacillus]
MKRRFVVLLAALFVTVSLSAYSPTAVSADGTEYTVFSDRQTGTVKP